MVRNSGYYRGISDFLVDNPLVKEGYQFNLNIQNAPIPQGMYYLSPAEGKLVAVGSGIRYDISSLFNGRYKVDVEVAPELQTASQARLEKSLSKNALTSITDGIQTRTSIRPLSPQEVAEFSKAGIDQRHAIGKELNKALSENARIVNRKVMSLDVESMVNKESKRIMHQDVFSVGVAESVDTTYSPEGKVLYQNPRLRKSTFAANSSFDIEKTISMFKQDVGEIEKVSTYGRQNLALVLDHVNKYVNGQATPDSSTMEADRFGILRQTFGSSSQLKEVQGRIGQFQKGMSLESIMEIRSPTARNDALNEFIMRGLQPYGEKGEKLVGFLENVSGRLKDTKLIKDASAVEHSAHAGTMMEFSLGQIDVAATEVRTAGTSKLSFKKDVMADSVLKMYNAVTNGGTKQILTFGDAESSIYRSYGLSLEKELGVLNNSGPLSREDQLKKRSINEVIEKLGTVRKAFVDVKERSEQVFDSLMPGVRQHLKENATGVRSVFERLLGSESTQRINQWGVERFLDQKHSGFSLENLYHVFKSSKYTEWHTGGMDSADLGHFNLWLEDLMKNQERYKAPSSKGMPGPGLTMLENKNLEMFNVTSKLARNIQSRTVINELLRDKSNDEVMGLVNKAFENGNERTKALIESSTKSLYQYKQSNESLFKKGVVELLQQTVNSELRDHSIKLNANPTSTKYRAPEPSLLGKVVSSAGAGRFFALAAAVYFGARNAQEDPGASIETGEHNSTETTQRRLATTPFGSSVSKVAAMMAPFAKKLVAGAEMGSLNPATYSGELQSFIRNHFDDASQVVTDRLAMSPAVDSLANRLARKTVLATDTATHIPSLRKSVEVMSSRMERHNLNFFERITNLRSERVTPRLTNPDNLALHMEGMNIHSMNYRDRFYMGSVPPARSISMELSPATKTFDTYLYGDPMSFAKQHQGIAMAEDVIIPNNKVPMTRPSFSIKQKRRAPERLIDSVRLKPGIIQDLSKQAEFPSIQTDSSPNISAMVVGRRQSKPGASIVTLTPGNSHMTPSSVFDIEGTLQNYSPIDKASPAAANVLRISAKDSNRVPVFTERAKINLQKNTFAINSSNVHLDSSPVYFSKPIQPTQQMVMNRPYRPTSGYHEQVNGLLQMKPKVGYPQKT